MVAAGAAKQARELVALNNRFYARNASSFSATRGGAWEGWRRVLEVARAEGVLGETQVRRGAQRGGSVAVGSPVASLLGGPAAKKPLVLDVACGNLRFERFLASELPGTGAGFVAVDSCAELAEAGAALPHGAGPAGTPRVDFRRIDVLDRMLNGKQALDGLPTCDFAVCFGFLHHVPGFELRARLLRELVGSVRPGGVVAVSLWQFMDNERLARKAREADAHAAAAPPFGGFAPEALEPGDHFLGWQGDLETLRFCHHFSETEVDRLAEAVDGRRRSRASRRTAPRATSTATLCFEPCRANFSQMCRAQVLLGIPVLDSRTHECEAGSPRVPWFLAKT